MQETETTIARAAIEWQLTRKRPRGKPKKRWAEKEYGNTEYDKLRRQNPESKRLENSDGGGQNS